ncbi:MAG: type 1 glutamine amidotransferase [Candidatus Levybacteria bacterium]|nr:type 1 glutamine amidotransferase [Candidatus Levybacteria bacterium]
MSYLLNIGWLYPDLMSTYGDRGNIIVLQKRCEWRDIRVNIIPIDQTSTEKSLNTIDLLFGGGAQDREQEIVMRNLMKKKVLIKEKVENGMPALFVCGAPQLMGTYYEPAEGKRIEGLGIFNMISKHPGPNATRLIGNTVAEVYWQNLDTAKGNEQRAMSLIVGFENHGGRTYLGENAKPFAKVIKGFGNNGEDETEGVVYKNAIGCYFHGPLLPKNPHIADWLIQTALRIKYGEEIKLQALDDSLERKAHEAVIALMGVSS